MVNAETTESESSLFRTILWSLGCFPGEKGAILAKEFETPLEATDKEATEPSFTAEVGEAMEEASPGAPDELASGRLR